MEVFGQILLFLALTMQVNLNKAMRCVMGQEPDPNSQGKYRWLIPVEDPCMCTSVRVGGVNKITPWRPFNVTYFDDVLRTKDPTVIERLYKCPTSCLAILDYGLGDRDGLYMIRRHCSPTPMEVYCDQTSNNGGWMRFYYKTGAESCTKYEEFTWTGELIRCLGLDTGITGFAVSDDIDTINTTWSWILNNGDWVFTQFHRCRTAGACNARDLLKDLGFANADVIANLANCKTPSGEDWSQSYEGGYATVAGTLSTNGNWDSTYYGCGNYRSPGDSFALRIGGAPGHTGEFVHTSCSDYTTEPSNRVTSRWDKDNVRAMWIRSKTNVGGAR